MHRLCMRKRRGPEIVVHGIGERPINPDPVLKADRDVIERFDHTTASRRYEVFESNLGLRDHGLALEVYQTHTVRGLAAAVARCGFKPMYRIGIVSNFFVNQTQ